MNHRNLSVQIAILVVILSGLALTAPGCATSSAQRSTPEIGISTQADATDSSSSSVSEKRIRDLDTDELKQLAGAGWMVYGLNPLSANLLYFGLERQPQDAGLLHTLGDLFVEDIPLFGATVYYYLTQTDEVELGKTEETVNTMFASAMWTWGLSSRRDGSTTTQMRDFEDLSLFEFDLNGLRNMISPITERSRSIDEAVAGIRRFAGLYGGALAHKDGIELNDLSLSQLFDDSQFKVLPKFDRWLDEVARTELEEFYDALP